MCRKTDGYIGDEELKYLVVLTSGKKQLDHNERHRSSSSSSSVCDVSVDAPQHDRRVETNKKTGKQIEAYLNDYAAGSRSRTVSSSSESSTAVNTASNHDSIRFDSESDVHQGYPSNSRSRGRRRSSNRIRNYSGSSSEAVEVRQSYNRKRRHSSRYKPKIHPVMKFKDEEFHSQRAKKKKTTDCSSLVAEHHIGWILLGETKRQRKSSLCDSDVEAS